MGNYISCTLSNPAGSWQSNSTKVIFPDGEIKQFHQLTNAAELMLETPNHFLVNSQSLHIGRRFSALSADEDLEIGNVYVLFPMRRLNSVITPGDMGRLLMTANSSVRRATAEGASPPEVKSWGERDTERLNLEEIEDDGVSEFKVRLAVCRSRRPLLETIAEETVRSR
ncbi:hypothetical protein CKAN_01445000 [Cinnamomum micranthum f. kanehirae]|uniref:DUF4228 domain-containing protein n=1 Tax=Cinnamomum micranthum f. kanehirae TaxID=337451 RepID=A0A3S3QIH3_9MAGN|nr:hypothetical protein CKAN_01445000 [Cinnamomum micranthum f. kanehirae]